MPISQIVTNSIADGNVTLVKIASGAIPELPQVIKPSITSPANNATGILENQVFTATSYLSLYGRSQANANWEISTSPTFTFINVNSTITGSNTQFQSNAASGLIPNTIHYARVRYSDDANNSSEYSNTVQFTTNTSFTFAVDYLVIAGGGSGGTADDGGAGGGAGGYRTSAGPSGGGASAESALTVSSLTNYTVTVGAGGTGVIGAPGPGVGNNGSNSVFSSITSKGGGGGGGTTVSPSGNPGGSGGGMGQRPPGTAGSGTVNQGFAGGTTALNDSGGGGGGAGSPGSNASSPETGGAGGNGVSSSITGSSVTRAGGGGAGGASSSGAGGPGGGGAGAPGSGQGGNPANTNTGSGGGGSNNHPSLSGNGGSGIVIIRYPDSRTISNPGGGLTYTTAPVSNNTVATFTAGTGNVSWS